MRSGMLENSMAYRGFAVVEVPSKAAAIAIATEFMQLAGDGSGEILQMFDPGGPPPGR